MRTESTPTHLERISENRATAEERQTLSKKIFIERTVLHSIVFVLSFCIFIGVGTLSVLLVMRTPENLFGLVLTGLLASGAFVVTFSLFRESVLRFGGWYFTESDTEEGVARKQWGKSITYAFLGLVLALLLAGLMFNLALASTGWV